MRLANDDNNSAFVQLLHPRLIFLPLVRLPRVDRHNIFLAIRVSTESIRVYMRRAYKLYTFAHVYTCSAEMAGRTAPISRQQVQVSILKYNFRFFDCRPMMEIAFNRFFLTKFFESYRRRQLQLAPRSLVTRLSEIRNKMENKTRENKDRVCREQTESRERIAHV